MNILLIWERWCIAPKMKQIFLINGNITFLATIDIFYHPLPAKKSPDCFQPSSDGSWFIFPPPKTSPLLPNHDGSLKLKTLLAIIIHIGGGEGENLPCQCGVYVIA